MEHEKKFGHKITALSHQHTQAPTLGAPLGVFAKQIIHTTKKLYTSPFIPQLRLVKE